MQGDSVISWADNGNVISTFLCGWEERGERRIAPRKTSKFKMPVLRCRKSKAQVADWQDSGSVPDTGASGGVGGKARALPTIVCEPNQVALELAPGACGGGEVFGEK